MTSCTVTGANDKEHLELMERVLSRLDSYNLSLNKKKCAFFQKEITFCGYRVDGEGLHKTPEKIQPIVDAPSPGNLSQLRAFLGMINYYHLFSAQSVNTAGTLTSPTTEGSKISVIRRLCKGLPRNQIADCF